MMWGETLEEPAQGDLCFHKIPAILNSFNTEPPMTNTTITLDQFHDLLKDAYAVSVNDTLYFVSYDTDGFYISDIESDDYVDLSTVDGDIEVHPNYVSFQVQEQPIQLAFLHLKKLM
jgi:hypothetical protein